MRLRVVANHERTIPMAEMSSGRLAALQDHPDECQGNQSATREGEAPRQLPRGYVLRQRVNQDHEEIQSLLRRAYPPPHGSECVWSMAALEQHLQHFPEGQFVIQDADAILRATSTTLRVGRERAFSPHTWMAITGMGTLSTHDPAGEILYGVNIAVDPDCQGRGLAHALYRTRFELGRRLGCSAFAAGARIPGFHSMAGQFSPEEYVARVIGGEIFDPTLSKQLALGFHVVGVLPDYAYDHETLGHAALIVKNLRGEG